MAEEWKNAKIDSTFIGFEHDTLTFLLGLKFPEYGMGFGGMTMDVWSDKEQKRVPHAIAGDCIASILETVGVDRWDDLKGEPVQVQLKDGMTYAIANILDSNKRFCPTEMIAKYFAESKV